MRVSDPGEKPLVVAVRSDPEPDHGIALEDAHRAPVEVDAYRVDRQRGMDFLES